MPRRRLHQTFTALSAGGLAVAGLALWAGVASAASGGGYSPSQMDCQPFSDDWATPQYLIYPGCHNLALNLESGGTTQGDANASNTRYLEFGMDQMGNDKDSKGTPTFYSVGVPGNTGSPHAGCLAFNTDGAGGGAAPYSQAPEAASKAENAGDGCGNNNKGAGFDVNFDYYQWYCPLVAAAGHPCEDPSYGKTTYAIDTGSALDWQPIVANGLAMYFGEDDNNDNTEHDGVGPFNNQYPGNKNDEGAENGASDGGGMLLSVTPESLAKAFSLTDPEAIVNYSAGFCADGICFEGTTQQQAVAHGCDAPDSYVAKDGVTPSATSQAPCAKGTPEDADVFNYDTQDPSVYTESPNCSSGDEKSNSNASCGPGGENALRSAEPNNEFAEPGLQLYADPDASRSPLAPAPLWPTPGIYIGTCGVYAGSPALPTASTIDKLPISNHAGQVAIAIPHC
jgi:hypothetical protein